MSQDQTLIHNYDSTLLIGVVSICVFFLFIATLHHYTRRSPLPYESLLVIAGVVYTIVREYVKPELPELLLTPDAIFLLILPILIFSSGRSLLPSALVTAAWPISYLSLIGVVISATFVGLPLAWMLDLPWSHGLMFGAAVAATDPSAVGIIFKRFPIPERLRLVMEGESLFNDGVTIVVFMLLASIVLTDATVNSGQVLQHLLWAVLIAIPLGWIAGWLMGKLVYHWHEQNQFVGLTLTILLAYSVFLLAEVGLNTSGVIAVLCASLAFNKARLGNRKTTKISSNELFHSFWDYLNTLASSLLFFTLGVAVGAHAFFWSWILPAVILLMLVSRALLVYSAAILPWYRKSFPMAWRHVMLFAGVRGALSAALVQIIPLDYPYRVVFLCLAFVLIMYSLIIHPPILKRYLANHPLK